MNPEYVIENCIEYVLVVGKEELFKLEDVYKHFKVDVICDDELLENMIRLRQARGLFYVSVNNFIKAKVKLSICTNYTSSNGCNQNEACSYLHVCTNAIRNESCDCNRQHTLYSDHNKFILAQEGLNKFSSNLLLDYFKAFLRKTRKKSKSHNQVVSNTNKRATQSHNSTAITFVHPNLLKKDTLIVLDINGTLLKRLRQEKRSEAKRSPNYYEPNTKCHRDWIYLRPHLNQLATYLNTYFTYMFWTTATPKYSIPMVQLLEKEGFTTFIDIWSQDKCEFNENSLNPNFKNDLKNLHKVHKEYNFDLSKIFLIDDDEFKVKPRKNLIEIKEFDPFCEQPDKELLRIIEILNKI